MRFLSPTIFAAIVLCFALPFGAAVNCEGTKRYDWTGFDLVTASVEAPPEYAEDAAELEGRWFLALLVLVAAVAGLILGVLFRARWAGLAAAAGLAATVALVAVPETVPNEQTDTGLALTFLAFVVLALLHGGAAVVRWWRRRPRDSPLEPDRTTRAPCSEPTRRT